MIEVATTAELTAACKVKGADILLTAETDYPGIKVYDCEDVTISAANPKARLTSGSTAADGFVRSTGLTLDTARAGTLYLQQTVGTTLNNVTHTGGLYVRGATDSFTSINPMLANLRGRGYTLHGLYSGKYEWIRGVHIETLKARQCGDDPLFLLGVDGFDITVDLEDISDHFYSGKTPVEAHKVHSDGVHVALAKNGIIRGRGSRIQWQGFIAGPLNAAWYPGHWTDNVTIDVEWDQIGSSYLGVPDEWRSGGIAVELFSTGKITVLGSARDCQYGGIVAFYSWNVGEKDPAYSYDDMEVFYAEGWSSVSTQPPSKGTAVEQAAGPEPVLIPSVPTVAELEARIVSLEGRLAAIRALTEI